jgi:hypothetical protein
MDAESVELRVKLFPAATHILKFVDLVGEIE